MKKINLKDIFEESKDFNQKLNAKKAKYFFEDLKYLKTKLFINEKFAFKMLEDLSRKYDIYERKLTKIEKQKKDMFENIILLIEKSKKDYIFMTEKDYNLVFKIKSS
tara:strand:- start:10214 stop:10534 length:321 start_codon:yes stop_codon:yes gene_type:complete